MKKISLLLLILGFLFSCSLRKTVDDADSNSEVIELSAGEDELLELGRETEEEIAGIEINDLSNSSSGNDEVITFNDSPDTVNVAGVENPGYEVTPQVQYDTTSQVQYDTTSQVQYDTTSQVQYDTAPQVQYDTTSQVQYDNSGNSAFIDPSEAKRLAQGRTVRSFDGSSSNFDTGSVYQAPRISNNGGQLKEYTVTENETLMMIAFKLYGNYTLWRDLARLNRDTVSNPNRVTKGTKVYYEESGNSFSWNPRGEPYLIKTGDTLFRISKKVYDNGSKWRYIWNNNRPLIKDPNLIFAGFTIYYLLNDGRDVATL